MRGFSTYTPTSIKELSAANPLEGFPLLQPPVANNMGSANMSYPITIPPGRHSLQPQINLSYNSQGGNGWMGLGWDISFPSISVETRWGVPLYSATQETESYLINGEQLLPLTYRQEFVSRVTNKQFYPRVEGDFNRIIRKGSSPTNYWWEVTDKNGIKYYYGKLFGSDALDVNSVLRDNNGNIAHWALTEVKDLNGNNVRYYYNTVNDVGVGSVMGRQLYVDTIKYTGISNTAGKYIIVFNLEDKVNKYKRKDVSISARYGFKQVTADLLKNIDVYYDTTLLKRYYFGYSNSGGVTYKTLLSCFGEMNLRTKGGGIDTTWNFNKWKVSDICGKIDDRKIELQSFTYYSESGFGTAVAISPTSNNVTGFNYTTLNNGVTALGGSASSGRSGGAALTLGVGWNLGYKSLSIGGNINWSTDDSYGLLTIIDIDGDGLPDKVFKNYITNDLKYRKQIYNSVTNTYQFNDTLKPITGVTDFLKTKSHSRSLGGELSLGVGTVGVNAGLESCKSSSVTSIYFADVNSDGLPDIIKDGVVYFNKKNGSFSAPINDTVYFGSDLCQYIVHSGSVNSTVFTQTTGDPYFSSWDVNVYHDAVRMWYALYSGTIKIEAPIQLVQDVSSARLSSTNANGVKYFIQYKGTNIKFDSIAANDYTIKNPVITQFAVTKGDRIYFRLNSKNDRSFDNVNWNPKIKYVTQDTVRIDADNKRIYKYKASEDFLLSAPQIYTMPFNGRVRFKGYYTMPAMSDNVILKLVKNGTTTVLTRSYTNAIAVNAQSIDTTFSVSSGDNLTVNVITSSNVQWSAISFYPVLYFDTIYSTPTIPSKDILGNRTVEFHPVIQYTTFPNPLLPSYPYALSGSITVSPSLQFSSSVSGAITLTVKRNNGLISKYSLTIVNGVMSQPIPVITVPGSQTVYFDYFTDNFILASAITTCGVSTLGRPPVFYQAGLHTVYLSSLTLNRFGNLYRGWGQFVYNNKNILPNNAMIEDSLVLSPAYSDTNHITVTLPFDTTSQYVNTLFTTYSSHNPLNNKFIYMQPDAKDTCWKGFGNLTIVKSAIVSNTTADYDTVLSNNPIPYISGQATAKAVNKISMSNTDSWFASLGVTFGSWTPSAGYSHSTGQNYLVSDFMDMNGDGYPDIVGSNYIQYTKPQGGLFTNPNNNINLDKIFKSSFSSHGATFGTTYMKEKQVPSFNPKTGKNKTEGSGSISASIGTTGDNSEFTLADINGDGLPDKIFNDGRVNLNLGYSFAPTEYWIFNVIQTGISNNIGTSAGGNSHSFSFLNSSINGGLGASFSYSYSNHLLMDVNGDGLADIVYDSAGTVYAKLNSGTGFALPIAWATIPNDTLSKSTSYSENINAAITFGTVLGVLPIKILVNPKGGLNRSINKESIKFIDLNNDGYPDYTVSSGETNLMVNYSKIGRTNLLKTAGNYAQGKILLDYKLSSQNNFDNPNRNWLLSSVKVFDGHTGDGIDSMYTTIEYDSAYYSRYDRQQLGYKVVKTHNYDTGNNNVLYRNTTEKFLNKSFPFKGLKYYDLITNASGNKYIENTYTYCLKNIASGNDTTCQLGICTNSDGTGYPALNEVNTYFYEGAANFTKHTRKRYEYGPKGNVKKYYDDGEVSNNYTDDDFYANITYHPDNNNLNLVGIPASITIKNNANAILQERQTSIDYNTGKVLEMRLYYDLTNFITYNMEYDTHGNMTKIIYPPNLNNQRNKVSYQYDNVVYTYPISVRDTLNYTSYTTYDYRWGKPTQTTDIGGNITNYAYDKRGRLKTLTAPYEIANTNPYTIKYKYWVDDMLGYIQANHTYWARTSHYDPEHPTDSIATVLFADGLGRTLQTKKDATVGGSDVMVVSGAVQYDAFGREVKKYYPITETLGHDSVFNSNLDAVAPTLMRYDVLNRQAKVIMPAADSMYYSYGFGSDKFQHTQFETTITDFKGNVTKTYTDVKDLKTSVKAPYTTWTGFVFNPLGTLLSSVDPENNTTTYTYDLLGRLTQRAHPDAGNTYFTYDAAGNIIQKRTQTLYNNNHRIDYNYNFKQLTAVIYPENPEQNVNYQYGTSGIGNNAGKLILQEDATGLQQFYYGKLGELTENKRTFVIPNAGMMTFAMFFQYDTWNRTKQITYADGEVVTYTYDHGGQLITMSGVKSSHNYSYVQDMQYDKFGSCTSKQYSNNIKTTYAYDPVRRRLQTLLGKVVNTGDTIQYVNYTYDAADNITQINKSATRDVDGHKYNVSCDYGYDNLYRLVSSDGSINNNQYNYENSLTYSPSGNILTKNVSALTLTTQGSQYVSYSNTYGYSGSQPHAVSTINNGNQDFSWDANGNMINWDNTNISRYMLWDEENRLKTVFDKDQSLSSYMYDAGGERSLKLQGDYQSMLINGQYWYNFYDISNYSLYTNPYMVLTPKDYTKHYYIEGDRVVSKIGGGMAHNPVGINDNVYGFNILNINNYNSKNSNNVTMINRDFETLGIDDDIIIDPDISYWLGGAQSKDEYEEQIYFYHKDNLGSSTQISDIGANIVHHLEYMPYGENFYEMRDTWETPYKFNGKEKDEETGLYYYGSRYYSPELSIWMSVDALSDKYPGLSPFMYCAGNPVILVDPDGKRLDKYFDSEGNLLLDTKKGNSEYVVKTYQSKSELTQSITNINDCADVDNITKPEYDKTVQSLEDVANGKAKIESVNRNNLVELPSKEIRDNFKQWCNDDRTGGTKSQNNMEYFATINGNSYLSNTGFSEVQDPSKGGIIFNINSRKPYIHSHPSGTNGTFFYLQFPTKAIDQQNSNTNINIMVPMGSGPGSNYYYLFNNKGVQAIFPRNKF